MYTQSAVTNRSIVYRDTEQPQKRLLVAGASLGYASSPDGAIDSVADASAQRINTAAFDGWRVNGLAYQFGIGSSPTAFNGADGTVFYGGRRGANWLKFRLHRFGWFHWPTKLFTAIGGAANYDRANLSRTVNQISPADGVTINRSLSATWGGLWSTPGGGDVSLHWRVHNGALKEDVSLNQAARDWIAANAPPDLVGKLLSDYYFSAVFQIDFSDIPRFKRGTQQQAINALIDIDDDELLSIEDAADNLLGILPFSDAYIIDEAGENEVARQRLRKRLYYDAATQSYFMAVGIRGDILNAAPNGTLYLDPTITPSTDASGDDGTEQVNGNMALTQTLANLRSNASFHQEYYAFYIDNTTIGNGDTIDAAKITLQHNTNGDAIDGTIYLEDTDSPAALTATSGDISGRTFTTASVPWSGTTVTGGQDSPSITAVVQEVIDRAGYVQDFMFIIQSAASKTSNWRIRTEDNGGNGPTVTIEYTVASTSQSSSFTQVVSPAGVDVFSAEFQLALSSSVAAPPSPNSIGSFFALIQSTLPSEFYSSPSPATVFTFDALVNSNHTVGFAGVPSPALSSVFLSALQLALSAGFHRSPGVQTVGIWSASQSSSLVAFIYRTPSPATVSVFDSGVGGLSAIFAQVPARSSVQLMSAAKRTALSALISPIPTPSSVEILSGVTQSNLSGSFGFAIPAPNIVSIFAALIASGGLNYGEITINKVTEVSVDKRVAEVTINKIASSITIDITR